LEDQQTCETNGCNWIPNDSECNEFSCLPEICYDEECGNCETILDCPSPLVSQLGDTITECIDNEKCRYTAKIYVPYNIQCQTLIMADPYICDEILAELSEPEDCIILTDDGTQCNEDGTLRCVYEIDCIRTLPTPPPPTPSPTPTPTPTPTSVPPSPSSGKCGTGCIIGIVLGSTLCCCCLVLAALMGFRKRKHKKTYHFSYPENKKH
jgi:hypothetical protein